MAKSVSSATPRKRKPRSKPSLRRILKQIPGYDPFETAEDCTLDEKAAQKAIDFFPECLHHVKGPKAKDAQPFDLEDWEKAIVGNTFGWKRPDGTRRYREVWVYVGRKNGKSMLGAGCVLYVLYCDGEPGAEIFSAAADRQQAGLIFDYGAGMVRREPMLRQRVTIYGGGPTGQQKAIALKDLSGSWKVLSADVETKWGLNVHCATVDEVHAHKNRRLLDTLLTSTGSRSQPIIFEFTTADWARESICNTKYDYACRVRDGITDDVAFLPVIHEATPDDDWHDEKVWQKANPNLGVSLSWEYLRREHRRALEEPSFENTFKRLHLNIITEQAQRWLRIEDWNACDGAVDAEELKGQRCYAGLDLSSTKDVTALVLVFPDAGNAILPFFWVPADNAEKRERRDRVPYMTWKRQGLVELTPGNVVDYRHIRKRANELSKDYQIEEIAYDPWNATQLALQLQDEDGLSMVEFRQGYISMNEPTKRLEALVIAGQLRHGGNPVLRWMASNVAVMTDAAGNIKPAKDKSSEKIDGIVATIMAIGLMMIQTGRRESVYETRGLLKV